MDHFLNNCVNVVDVIKVLRPFILMYCHPQISFGIQIVLRSSKDC